LARVSVNNNQYNKAENFMHQIREGELSIPAARLKAYIYRAQERGHYFVRKKRESNRYICERYDEISLELAHCYIAEAELRPLRVRSSDLQAAKFLIAAAGRKLSDPNLIMQKDYMYAMVAFMEGNQLKANEILSRTGMSELQNAEISTITDAAQAWHNIGNTEKAKEFLKPSQEKLKDVEDSNEKTISGMLVAKSEDTIGERRPQALELNKVGLQKHTNKNFVAAVEDSHQAYLLFSRKLAFSFNLLQCLVDGGVTFFKKVNTLELLKELQNRKFSEATSLPYGDGLTLIREIQAGSDVVIIIISGKTSEIDRVEGLEVGADDYIIKPFSPRELLARVQAVFRRTHGNKYPDQAVSLSVEIAEFLDWKLDLSSRRLMSKDDKQVELTTAEFDLLRAFVEAPNRVLSRDFLLNQLHSLDWVGYDRGVDGLVSRLRRKLKRSVNSVSLIKTVRSVGYIFTASVKKL
jgi:DNA-binding response OmpR family regulator